MNTRWIAVLLASACSRAASPATAASGSSAKIRPRRPPRPTSSSASPTCSRATTRWPGKSSSARSSRTPRTRTCTPASGCCTTARARPKLADKHFREALRLAPDNPDISNNYAIYLCKNGRVDEGVERFAAVAANKYYRTPEVALTNAGVCLRGAKRLDEAQQRFTGAIKARPNYSEATVQLATLHMERGQLRRGAQGGRHLSRRLPPESGRAVRRGDRGARRQGQDGRREILAHAAPGIPGLRAGARAQARQLSSMDETAAHAPRASAAFDRRAAACRPRTLRPVDRGGGRKAAPRHQGHRSARGRPLRRARRVGVRARPPAPLRRLRGRAGRRAGQQLHRARRASAAARSHAGAARRAARGSAPAGDAARRPVVRGGAAARHLVGARRLAFRRRGRALVGAVHGGAGQRDSADANTAAGAGDAGSAGVRHARRPRRQRRPQLRRRGTTAAQRSAEALERAAPARETRLKLDLTNDSWVEVYDSRGERLFYDVASAGSVQSVSGRGPLARGARQCGRRHRRSRRPGARDSRRAPSMGKARVSS